MNEPIETVIIRGQQKFDLYDVLNPVQIQINNDRILNTLKNTNTFTTSCPYLHFISVICNKRYQANICHLQDTKWSKNSINKWKNIQYTGNN